MQYQDFIERIHYTLSSWQSGIEEFRNHMINSQKLIIEKFQKIEPTLTPLVTRAKEFFDSLHEVEKKLIVSLGKEGWYLSPDIPFPDSIELTTYLKNRDKEGVERYMTEYYKKYFNKIREDIIKSFPHRKKIITSAFKAHERGEYELSIPVILGQADGICYEVLGVQLYSKEKKIPNIPKTAKKIEQLFEYASVSVIFELFFVNLPISANRTERREQGIDDRVLNRHTILHGESVRYDNEINSLKALSWICYVVKALSIAKNEFNSDT